MAFQVTGLRVHQAQGSIPTQALGGCMSPDSELVSSNFTIFVPSVSGTVFSAVGFIFSEMFPRSLLLCYSCGS